MTNIIKDRATGALPDEEMYGFFKFVCARLGRFFKGPFWFCFWTILLAVLVFALAQPINSSGG